MGIGNLIKIYFFTNFILIAFISITKSDFGMENYGYPYPQLHDIDIDANPQEINVDLDYVFDINIYLIKCVYVVLYIFVKSLNLRTIKFI